MQKRMTITIVGIFSAILMAFSLTGCKTIGTYQDGVYTAQFENFDSTGYKDMIQVTVENGEVTNILYDAISENGSMKNHDEKYAEQMMEFQKTSPEQYSKDLVNQFMASQGIKGVDSVAGATYSSRCFIVLYLSLEDSMVAQDESLVIVKNISEG